MRLEAENGFGRRAGCKLHSRMETASARFHSKKQISLLVLQLLLHEPHRIIESRHYHNVFGRKVARLRPLIQSRQLAGTRIFLEPGDSLKYWLPQSMRVLQIIFRICQEGNSQDTSNKHHSCPRTESCCYAGMHQL